MQLDLLRDKSTHMPSVADCAGVTSLRIWHCAYSTLEPIANFANLDTLVIGTFPDASFECLSALHQLKQLRVVHLPKVSDLCALESLTQLRVLALETLPSWDASRKWTEVASLEPLARLPGLEHVSLLGVLPKDRSLAALERCTGLRTAKVHGFSKDEAARFFSVTGVLDAHCPDLVGD